MDASNAFGNASLLASSAEQVRIADLHLTQDTLLDSPYLFCECHRADHHLFHAVQGTMCSS